MLAGYYLRKYFTLPYGSTAHVDPQIQSFEFIYVLEYNRVITINPITLELNLVISNSYICNCIDLLVDSFHGQRLKAPDKCNLSKFFIMELIKKFQTLFSYCIQIIKNFLIWSLLNEKKYT